MSNRPGHKDPNPANPNAAPKRVAIVVSNAATSGQTGWPIGFWWSELAHPYHAFIEAGYEVEVFSPDGGPCIGDALSDPRDPSRWSAGDLITMGFIATPETAALVENTRRVAEIELARFDAIVCAGGQGPMYTFETATDLHAKFVAFYEAGKVAAALCHGSAILKFARLSDGAPLVRGKTVTGFANIEEDWADEMTWNSGALARGTHIQPWRIEDAVRALGGHYSSGGLWRGFAVRDGNLVTGQQNFSGTETAQLIIEALGR
ncbi:MAG: type 1 glutamine amidotransferase domain-containing protein [Alphaproteobacteria bacterium]|nr:type 1 glutamine amidotransferase domain-containing protein [Alphaproteobacteria bacterium]